MLNNEEILFYIVVPVYKAERYIKDCVDSVLNQSYHNYRLILVDDGSPDESGKICDKYALDDSRIHVIHQKNMGQLVARETGFHYIKASYNLKNSYILWLDSDDSLKLNALERLAQTFKKEKCDMIIYGYDRTFNGQIIDSFKKGTSKLYNEKDKRSLYKKVFFTQAYNGLSRKAMRMELIPDFNYKDYYKILRGEDLLRSIDLYKVSSTVYFLQESLYNYSINFDSITHNVNAKNYIVDFIIYEKVYDFLQAENVFDENDWAEFYGFHACSIAYEVAIIACFNITYDEKLKYYEKIKKSNYYKKISKNKKIFKSNIMLMLMYHLFEINAYQMFEIYSFLMKPYHKVKNFMLKKTKC